jgi:hypothetical protein
MTYIPVKGDPFTVSMGLRTMPLDSWIEIDEHYDSEIDQKRELLSSRRNEVFAELPQGLAGSTEVLEMLMEYLPKHFPERFSTNMPRVENLHPLEAASLLVQEDLVIMSPKADQWILTAASVCFPSRWDLTEKVGADLHAIHGPVPHYEERIGQATDSMFHKLTSDRPVWRINWTVLDSPELFQPSATGRKARQHRAQTVEEFGKTMFFRTERQTLWKLPNSGDILFTIRTYVDSLASLAERYPDFRNNLGKTIVTASQDTRSYKGWAPIWQDILAWTGVCE